MLEIPNLRRLAGKHVVGPDGERIGKVSDVYESTSAGGGTFATVATGLFGSSSSFFPLHGAELDGDEIRVPYSKDFVKQAPRVDNNEELTSEEEDRLFAYYEMRDPASEGDREMSTPELGAEQATDPDDPTMTLSEERLVVGTERVVVGRARLRKYVVSETVTQTVDVSHEELRISREPVPLDVAPHTGGAALTEEEHEVVLFADRAVVHKSIVPVERVRLDTVTVTGQETVTGQVRKEHVELDESDSTDQREPREGHGLD